MTDLEAIASGLLGQPAGQPVPVSGGDICGRDLATLHASGAESFGQLPPGADRSWVGTLPMPTGTYASAAGHLACRLRDAARIADLRGRLPPDDLHAVDEVGDLMDELLGPVEPPSRLHGDLWCGNILWTDTGRAMLVDPAAHGGHRETDLAMLALFGAPYLRVILAAYQEVSPLNDGWKERVALHQLHPLLVHAAMFGGRYVSRVSATLATVRR